MIFMDQDKREGIPLDTQYGSLCKKLNAMDCIYRVDEPMVRHTSFKIGGPADVFAEPSNVGQAAEILKFCFENEIPYQIIGNGTNLLIDDRGIRGL
jgi:UDP-N-acetylmuramate dehydrogenase